MESNYNKFLDVISILINKRGECDYWRYGTDEIERENKINKNPVAQLVIHLKPELEYFSKLFQVDKESSLVISALLLQYKLCKNADYYFITMFQLASSFCLQISEFSNFTSTLSVLQSRKIIEVKDFNFSLLNKIEEVDKGVDYFDCLESSLDINQIKTYEFTEVFIEKIKNL